ncbi:urate hydroxylase PuuD [Methylophaga sp. OBS4]|uniref:urate hydroxylase PuuD n=1 Tax=Methylophaga sp. OBS4 TaxID=2991935 RepID=UPI00225730EB|nr:urate hydroxylase PuuD [Methylophaga sp. OBS4]MCX4187045.1 urate hydroxylase PuuD [Methylophaga sp. OBS4]
MTLTASLDIFARWFHLLGILVWMGHNYANVIQNPRFKPAQPSDPGSMLAAMKREHGTFRYASLVVLATGVYMLWYKGLLIEALTLSGSSVYIGLGVWLGIIMVLNLWFVLWPHQKKVLGFIAADDNERIRCSRITFLSSRTNTILSVFTLFFMISGSHGLFLFS